MTDKKAKQLPIQTDRQVRLGLTVSPQERDRLEQARKLAGARSLADFIRGAALEKAAQLGARTAG